ncbi:MAG: ABC-F family ATP-binding cassette domain-containing protein [Planctomycetia bacterium]|nr:ABC-F family ATP-binding cassette domain-containing protein [Planctomycetia bacterium]
MLLLSVDSLRKYYGPDPVLDGVTFDVHPGQKIGLVGPNGTGKSTLMKILAEKEEADAGRCIFHPNIRVGYLQQRPEATERTLWEEAHHALADLITLQHDAQAVAEALATEQDEAQREKLAIRFDHLQQELLRQDAYNLDYKVERVLQGLGFQENQMNTPVMALSGGEQNRLMLAKLLLAEPELMLLDEPSNHLDLAATEWLETFLVESDAAVIVVSHDRYFLDKVTNRTLELLHGTVDSYTGNFSAYLQQKEERLLVQRRTWEKQQEEIAKTEDFIRRNHYGMKAAQAEDRRKKLERIQRVDPPREISTPPMSLPHAERSGDIVVRINHLTKGFSQELFRDITFDIQRAQRWGIIGPNGCGKSTLLKCLLGQISPDSGNVILGQGVKIGYFDQQLESAHGSSLAVDAVRPSDGREMDEPARRSLCARFGITGDMVFQKVESLSGGERCRVALARLSSENANFLILDEPTNHLDLWAREALEKMIKKFEGTVLFVSHDRYFINQVATHLLIMDPEKARIFPGNYQEWTQSQASVSPHGNFSQAATTSKNTGKSSKPTSPKEQNKKQEKNTSREDLWKQSNLKKSQKKNHVSSGNSSSDDSAFPAEEKSPSSAAPEKKAQKKKRRFPYRKVSDLEDEIFIRETLVDEILKQLQNPMILRDGQQIRKLQSEMEQEQEILKSLYEHWEEASEMNW